MSRRSQILFGTVAALFAALFMRLGVWQLDRRAERLERIERQEGRGAAPPLELSGPRLPPIDSVRWRRVRLRGRYDPDREIVLRARSRNGTPGVETLTPLRIGAGDEAPAVLVLRGWLPAQDGLRGDLSSGWPAGTEAAPPRTVTVEGIAVEASPPGDARPLRLLYEGTEHLVLVTADPTAAGEALPYPVASFYVRATDPGPAGPALRPPRPLDTSAGPHLSYAIQWFSFAVIALVGTALYVRKESAR